MVCQGVPGNKPPISEFHFISITDPVSQSASPAMLKPSVFPYKSSRKRCDFFQKSVIEVFFSLLGVLMV